MKIRRVVTGHDQDGRAIVVTDDALSNAKVMPSGNIGCLVWATDETPAAVDGTDDPAERAMGIAPSTTGTVFRVLNIAPGQRPFMHRTNTIDYCVVLEGECTMLLDDKRKVTLRSGDVLVQRGTWHGWANCSDKPCRIAFVLIGANAPEARMHEE